MSETTVAAVDALVARAQDDAALRDRLIADPKGTIEAETGLTVPADWNIMTRDNGGSLELAFENDELPDDYLELVSGGLDHYYDSCPGFDPSRN
jgi:hypothetical protein